MRLGDLLEKVNIEASFADMELDVRGISYDTRTLQPGDLFVAFKGLRFDGHEHIEEAIYKGAVCVVCAKAPTGDVPYIIVSEPRKALAGISAAWFGYPADKLKIVGVTGTNGKTTVATMVKRIIEYCGGGKAGLIGTNGNMIGSKVYRSTHTTPESYELQKLLALMADNDCRYVVMEVSSHALAMSRVHGICFEVGIYTNLSPDHLDFHNSMDEYANVKASFFTACRYAAINIDDAYAPLMIDNASGYVYKYSVNNHDVDLHGTEIKLMPDKVEFLAIAAGKSNKIELYIPGLYTIYNALAAISAGLLLGVSIECVVPALQIFESVSGRAEVVTTGTDYTVLIDYAHTPDALLNIISATREYAQGRIVTLFGCGGDRDRSKRPIMGDIASRHSDFVIVTSDNPRSEEPGAIIAEILTGMADTKTPYMVIENRRDAIRWALDNSRTGDVLILAGKGHETYQIVGTEKRHFDEREIVSEYFAE